MTDAPTEPGFKQSLRVKWGTLKVSAYFLVIFGRRFLSVFLHFCVLEAFLISWIGCGYCFEIASVKFQFIGK